MRKHILLALKFCQGEYDNSADGGTWRAAFEYLRSNFSDIIFDKTKIHTLWTVNGGHLRRNIEDDGLVLAVLILALPGYEGDGLTLYRGECRFLYDENKTGFCWSPDVSVASGFAKGLNALELGGGVLLRAYAPASAILAGPNDHSVKQMQEFEYTCNPRLLQDIEIMECFEKPG